MSPPAGRGGPRPQVAPPPVYVCGHSAGEIERLEAQGAFFEPITRAVLVTAGVSTGMRVLDIGCGAGDLTLLAAALVGPSGSVLGIDRTPDVVAVAAARAAAQGLSHVTFRLSEIDEWPLQERVDAVIGRFVLMHQADPARILRSAARHVQRGGLVAVLESHMSASLAGVHSAPHAPTYHRILEWIVALLRAAGAHPDMGLRLRQTFLEAGLPAPALSLHARVEGGADAAIYRYTTQSLRSMLPAAERLGLAPPFMGDLEDLETRLREEATAAGGVLTSPLVVGAWCRIP